MNYPIDLSFKLIALASQIYIRDADGNLIGYVKQKLLKLKEDINVFADESQTQHLYNIKADRVLDFSARYNFTDPSGKFSGAVKRRGMRSLWRSSYEIFDSNLNQVMQISEEKAWVKLVDTLVGEIPVLGIFTGYMFHPAYIVSRLDGNPLVRVQKQPAFFESKFRMTDRENLSDEEEKLVLLSVLTMVLLERSRG